jgi:hypothetical protein
MEASLPDIGTTVADRFGGDDGLSSRELLVAEALGDRDPQLGSLYRWAARTVRTREPDGWVHLVAHFVRDLLNRLPEHFNVPAADPASVDELLAELAERWSENAGTLEGDVTERIAALLVEYRRGGENQDRRAEAVIAAMARDAGAETQVRAGISAWRQLHKYFQRIAHLRSGEKSRRAEPIDEDEVALRFDALTALLAVRVAGEGFFETLAELDALAEVPEPTREQAVQAAAAMRDGLADAFLARLHGPGWLAEAARLGVFSQPPPAVREGGYVQAPYWAAAEYLTRVADRAPVDVLAIIEAIPETDNERVQIAFAEAALRMPSDEAARLAGRVRGWLERSGSTFGLAEVAAQLAAKLAAEGKSRRARQLLDAALGLHVTEFPSPRVVGHGDAWHVEEVLSTHFEALVEADPLGAAGFLAGLLQRLTEQINALLEYEENSSIIRPAIEEHEQNTDLDARGSLIRAVRDVGERIVSDYPEHAEQLLAILGRGPGISKRIALHLLRLDDSAYASDRRHTVLMDLAAYEETELLHERFLLLTEHYGELPDVDRAAIAEALANGPDRDRLFGPVDSDDPEAVDRRDAAAADWQLRWFAAIGTRLPDPQAALRDELEARYGASEHPDFLSWHTTWVGPTSPEREADLREMPIDDVIVRLGRFQGGQRPATPSHEGLGRVFESVVIAAPQQWAAAATRLLDVAPIYARHFFQGLDAAVRAGQHLESWPEVLSLAEQLANRGPAPRLTSPSFDQEEQAGHVRASLGRLLTGALAANSIPYECRRRVWDLLGELAVDPDPDEEYERRRAESREPAYSPAVATVRGSAIEGVIVYAQWVAHHQRQEGGDASLSAYREVADLLLARLGGEGEPSPGVLGVIGATLPVLVQLDLDWTVEHLKALLAPGASTDSLAIWRSYVVWARVHADTFNVLIDQYHAALRELPDVHDCRYLERLGEHLALAALHGLPGAPELLDEFFKHAPSEARKRLIGWIGRVSNPANHEGLAPQMRQRREQLTQLWDKRLEAVDDGDGELPELGWWYASGIFDSPEDLERLVTTVKRASGEIEHIRAVLRQAAAVAPLAPGAGAELAEILVAAGLRERLNVANAMLPLLQALLATDQARDRARAVIDELGEIGFLGAGTLITAP